MTIGGIIYQDKESHIVIADLVGHDDFVLYPPLPLSALLPETNTLIGRYTFVIGYPFHDNRMPQKFIDKLLDKKQGHKRLMPGRILALSRPGGVVNPGLEHLSIFTTDISTSSGTAGGPLVDLTTATVIGVSFSGVWKGERGKFSYAEPIPKAALDFIARRLVGASYEPG